MRKGGVSNIINYWTTTPWSTVVPIRLQSNHVYMLQFSILCRKLLIQGERAPPPNCLLPLFEEKVCVKMLAQNDTTTILLLKTLATSHGINNSVTQHVYKTAKITQLCNLFSQSLQSVRDVYVSNGWIAITGWKHSLSKWLLCDSLLSVIAIHVCVCKAAKQ